jgi:hypothetical protein
VTKKVVGVFVRFRAPLQRLIIHDLSDEQLDLRKNFRKK